MGQDKHIAQSCHHKADALNSAFPSLSYSLPQIKESRK